ncbi:hypothetical protein DY000_02011598 [Brassica cretica]|uniref:Histidinol dehydrogenase n=1 Tax=Brassica cretica TaxID=69181 RepID=A0ABQ7CYF2_BRACR|nr:hypothetical protein DY000_02011598 [Brassica cretica]
MSVDLSRLSLLYSPRLSYSSHTAAKKGDVRCAMKSYRLSELSFSQVENLKSRPRIDFSSIFTTNSEAMVSIDMPAGPSEVLVIADEHASPVYIAADLLSQAEHGPDSQVVLVIVGDGVNLKAIEEEIAKQCKSLPRGEFASKALSHSFTVFARDMIEAITFSNLYAPEHLIINVKDAEKWEGLIENAGSVFVGPWTPESVGDYASGTNHVLPTYGYARMYSGVSLDSFLKFMTVQSLTEEGLRNLGPYVATMAEIEGLDAHKRAVTLRLKDIEAKQASQTK